MVAVEPQIERKVRIENGKLVVELFETADKDILSYFQERESQLQTLGFEHVLKTGTIALKTVAISEKIDYIQKEFLQMNNSFNQNLSDAMDKLEEELGNAFGEDGRFAGLLKEHFGEDGKIVKELFDPARKGSPLNTLRDEIRTEITRLKVDLKLEEKTEEIEQKTSLKGAKFEGLCEVELSNIARVNGDKFERTSDVIGKIQGSKKGDFVVELKENSKRIVFEMKDSGKTNKFTFPEIRKIMDESIENRDAAYGIFLVRNVESLPQSIGMFNEYDGNKLVCALGNGESNGALYNEILLISFKWAKAKILLEASKQNGQIDTDFIKARISKVQAKISDLRNVKTNCTNIENATEKIRKAVTDIEQDINEDLSDVLSSLSPKHQN